MKRKEKRRSTVWHTVSGRGMQKGKTSTFIVKQSGFPVNGIFSCDFLRQVVNLLSQPVTVDQIAEITESENNRVRLALHDLVAAGVDIRPYTKVVSVNAKQSILSRIFQ